MRCEFAARSSNSSNVRLGSPRSGAVQVPIQVIGVRGTDGDGGAVGGTKLSVRDRCPQTADQLVRLRPGAGQSREHRPGGSHRETRLVSGCLRQRDYQWTDVT